MIKISVISYFNSLPFIYGLKQSKLKNSIDMQLDYPSICAARLISREVDLALVPIVVIPSLKEFHVISDFCIGANGGVETVCLYSDVPINKIKIIALDYQSKTSVALLKILLKEYWNFNPKLINSKAGFENKIRGTEAALVIGDRAFDLNKKHHYIYDLSAIWKEMTGLPFVFAAWIANIKLPNDFVTDFNKALEFGLININNALEHEGDNYPNCENPRDYLNNKISYRLDSKKLESMELFLKKI
jgi:chorismate dehydratase